MIPTTIGRLVWREYRVTRGLWISLWLVTLLMFLSPLVLRELQSITYRDFHVGWAIILCMPLIYLVGTVATAFNREHENGTYAMLRQSPATPTQIATAKIGFSIFSALLLLAAMTASFLAIRSLGWMPPLIRSTNPMDTSLSPSVMIQWLLYLGLIVGTATLSSVYIRQPLVAVGVAGVAPLLPLLMTNILSSPQDPAGSNFHLEPLGQLLLGVFDCLLLSIAGQAASGWLHEKQLAPLRFRSAKASSIEAPMALSSRVRTISPRRHLSRVLWIDRWKYLIYFMFAIVVGQLTPDLSFIYLLVFSTVLGGTLFAYEQSSHHKHFLVERGVSGLRVWTLRQLIGCTLILVALASWGSVQPIRLFVTFLLPLYAAAHLCSLFFKSRIHAIVSAFLISGLGAFVLHFFWVRMQMPFWLIGLLPFVGLMLVGALRANRWLMDRNHWRDWLVPGAVLVSLGPAWLVVANVFRANELPAPPMVMLPELPDKVPMSESEKLVCATHIHMLEDGDGEEIFLGAAEIANYADPLEEQWLQENADVLTPELLDAINKLDTITTHDEPLPALLVASARRLQLAGQLDEASAYYLAAVKVCVARRRSGEPSSIDSTDESMILQNMLLWAVQPGQTNERIRELWNRMEEEWKREPAWNAMARCEYRRQKSALNDIPKALDEFGGDSPLERLLVRFIMALPGERIRANRWLDFDFIQAESQLDELQSQEWKEPVNESFSYDVDQLRPVGMFVPDQVRGIRRVIEASGKNCHYVRIVRQLTKWGLLKMMGDVAEGGVPVEFDVVFVSPPEERHYVDVQLPLRKVRVNTSGHETVTSPMLFFVPTRESSRNIARPDGHQ